MPMYEYWCPKCQKEFEIKRLMADLDKPAFCPGCGAEGEKLVSTFASKIDYALQLPAKPPFRKTGSEKKG